MTNSIDNHPDQIDKLIQEYPVVFKHIDDTAVHSLPAGWYTIMNKLCSDLTPLLEEALQETSDTPEEPLFSVLQIKEKFGGLRFYYTMNTKNDDLYRKVQAMIDNAEDASYETCQITGKPGALCKSGSWYMTLCEESRISMGYKIIGNG
jgi:hypothetical protein